MRKKCIEMIEELAKKDRDILVLVGDLGFGYFDNFRMKFPNRFQNMGISEQNMIGVAAGLAMTGKKVIIYSIMPFVTFRCLEQIRNDLCIPNLNVAIIGIGTGIMYGTSGSTHHGTEDIGIMNSLPNMTIFSPGTEKEVEECTKNLFKIKGPVYMRLGKLEQINNEDSKYGFIKLYGEKDSKISLFTTGNMLSSVLEVKNILINKGVSCNVIHFHIIKPIKDYIIPYINTKSILFSIEEHNINNGFGSIISNLLHQYNITNKFIKIGIEDMFVTEIGNIQHIRKKLKLTPEAIVERILNEKDFICN